MSYSFSYVGDVLAKKAHTHSLPLDMLWHNIPLCQVILSLVLNDSLYSPALWPCSRAKLASGYVYAMCCIYGLMTNTIERVAM
ncbi:hypothetical protein D6C91_02297 [Aureobasidium pullulans]|uniref:Uncharacterized protein n=1 Tax=Aureobasidium pullulans TaxID=5580 RepID=A0A4S9TS51_AURPU|nr:hypothetical protein D6C91_02297 [Aureobasidium pullulans]